jgi:hypothetical protein
MQTSEYMRHSVHQPVENSSHHNFITDGKHQLKTSEIVYDTQPQVIEYLTG